MKKVLITAILLVLSVAVSSATTNNGVAGLAHVAAEFRRNPVIKSPEMVTAWAHNRGEMIYLEAQELKEMASDLQSIEYRTIADELMDAAKKLLSLTPPRTDVIAGRGENTFDLLKALADQAHMMALQYANLSNQTDDLKARKALLNMAHMQGLAGQDFDKALSMAMKSKPEESLSHCTKEIK